MKVKLSMLVYSWIFQPQAHGHARSLLSCSNVVDPIQGCSSEVEVAGVDTAPVTVTYTAR